MIVAAAGAARSAVTASRTREMARKFITANGAAFSDALFLSYLGLDPSPPPGQQLHGAPWIAAPVRHAHHDGEWPYDAVSACTRVQSPCHLRFYAVTKICSC